MTTELTRGEFEIVIAQVRSYAKGTLAFTSAVNTLEGHDAAQRDQREQDRQRIQELEEQLSLEQGKHMMTTYALVQAERQLSTLTQALAQAKKALASVLEQWINGRKVKDGMSLTLRLHIESLLAVPAAGGGCEYCSAHGATFLDGCTDPIHYPKPAAAPAPTPGLEVPAPESHHFGWRYDETNLPSPPEPPGLVWTEEKPTAPGLYGYREKDLLAGAEVRQFENVYPLDCRLTNGWAGLVDSFPGHWCGPIALPEPLKGA